MRAIQICIYISILLSSCSHAQNRVEPQLVGGACEGCEAVFEFGDQQLASTDTLPGFHEGGLKIQVKGTIYKQDGRTPAQDVILYIYHTNQKGIYQPKENSTGWGRTHGYIRTWIKTDQNGQYSFYTLKPAAYPSGSERAHIHYTILEPNGKYYWLNSCHFEGDSLLTTAELNPNSPRGGTSGLLRLKMENGIWVGTRDIILGRNIPGYVNRK